MLSPRRGAPAHTVTVWRRPLWPGTRNRLRLDYPRMAGRDPSPRAVS